MCVCVRACVCVCVRVCVCVCVCVEGIRRAQSPLRVGPRSRHVTNSKDGSAKKQQGAQFVQENRVVQRKERTVLMN